MSARVRPTPRKARRRAALRRHVARLERRITRRRQRHEQLIRLRLFIFLGGFVVAGSIYFTGNAALFGAVLLVTGLLFSLVVRAHRRVEISLQRHVLLAERKRHHLARMALAWDDIPLTPAIKVERQHPFAADLDVLGPRSLHHLLDTTITDGGSKRLQQWLIAQVPEPRDIQQRRGRIEELIRLTPFRDRLAVEARLASAENERWSSGWLLRWLGQTDAPLRLRRWLIVLSLLAGVNVVLFVLNMTGRLPAVWPLSLTLYAGLSLLQWRVISPAFVEALSLEDALRQLFAIFQRLEERDFGATPELGRLCRPFQSGDERPSRLVRRISSVVSGTALRNNPFVWLILNAVVPWDYYFAYRLTQVRRSVAAQMPRWLEAWYELEALNALANLAYLNPEYTFPLFRDREPVFTAEEIGHPLLPDEENVHNDFTAAHIGDVALITGSNMSGKSTFLRTIGCNLILAYAGGPVNAARLETRTFRLFSSIRLTDSLTDGVSYFYAEVQRLRTLLDRLEETRAAPLFFFIDEIFRGTNNRERLIGSRAYTEAIAGRSGVGLISTHDLELVQLAEQNDQLRNYHFRDDIVGREMVFDYVLRPGPSPTTNALKIMAAAGLPVGATADGRLPP